MSKENSRITSIVPTIEGRQSLLLRSIESLVTQRLPEGVEHEILISLDSRNSHIGRTILEAVEALQLRAGTHIPIRLVNRGQGPGGVAEARNRALQQATGDVIYFLNDDDVALARRHCQPAAFHALSFG